MTLNTDNSRVQPSHQLLPVPIGTPGTLGLNTESAGQLLSPDYAADCPNAIIDANGRLAARYGTAIGTPTPFTATVGNISGITQAVQAVVTVSNVIGANPFYVGQIVTFAGVGGMTQINGLTANVIAVGGASGAWTATINLNTTSFSAFTAGGTMTGNYAIYNIFEGNFGGGNYQPLVSSYFGISNSLTNPAGNVISGPFVGNGAPRYFFQNFNNKVIAFAPNSIGVYNGSGTFGVLTPSSGTVPQSGIGATCFGRVWAVDLDLQTLRYSGLLNETDWGSSDSGTVDMHTIWSAGTDQITAVFAFNSMLVVCGLKHIVTFTDGRGSLLGIDPTQMYVNDIITGTGCLSQFTVQVIGQSDVFLLGPVGVQSLARLLAGTNNPLTVVTKYVRTQMLAQLSLENTANLSSTYDPLQGFYLLAFPVNGIVWCLDVRRQYVDDSGDKICRVTYWNMTAYALATFHNNVTWISRTPGQVCFYSGSADEGGASYTFNWTSPWIKFPDELAVRLKLLKRLKAILQTGNGTTVTFGWNTDFSATSAGTYSFTTAGSAGTTPVAQYGLGQYGLSQYGLSSASFIAQVDARGRGQYYQLSISCSNGAPLGLSQLQAYFKLGRTA